MSLEQLLVTVGDVLGTATPATDQSFIEIGGSSLAALKILARYEREHGVRIDPGDFLSCEVLGEAAGLLATHEEPGREVRAPGSGASLTRAPASVAQAWVLAAEKADTDAPALQFQVAFELRGPLDDAALAAALQDVHHHHEALRVRFEGVPDSPEMVLHQEPHRMRVVEHPRGEELDDATQRAVTSFARASFDAASPERWRSLLLRHNTYLWTLCLAFDHRTVDGWSLGIVLNDLSSAYAARRRDARVELPPAGSYLEACSVERQEHDERLHRALQHWRPRLPESFEDFPVTIPGRADAPSMTWPEQVIETVPDRAARALDVASTLRRTPFVVATTALARTIRDLNGDPEPRVLTSSANRRLVGTERTVGWFATGIFPTYPLDPDRSWQRDMDVVAQESSAALAVGEVPAVSVRRALWPSSPAGFRQDSGVYLACSDARASSLQLGAVRAVEFEVLDRADAPGIQLFVQQRAAGWQLACYFHRGEYPVHAVRDLIDRFYEQLSQLTKDVLS